MSVNKRSDDRFSTSIPLRINFPAGQFAEGWGRTLNISGGGLMIETRFPIKVGAIIYATFDLKDGAHFDNLRARVVRVNYEDGYFVAGIAFDDIVDKQTLRSVVSALAYQAGWVQV